MYPMHMAQRFGIGLVFGNENGEAEYGGDTGANERPSWGLADWDRIYLKGSGVARLVEVGRDLGVLSDADLRDISEFYSLPRFDEWNRPEWKLDWHLQ